MEIFLTAGCSSLSGFINKRLGYFIARRNGRFFSQRSNKMQVPPDGHWRFIETCAQLAQNKYCIADIKVAREEIENAVGEAGWCLSRFTEKLRPTLNAKDVLDFKNEVSL